MFGSVITFLHSYPFLWPAALCLILLPVLLVVARSHSLSTRLEKAASPLIRIWGIGGIGILVFCSLAYLCSPALFDFFECAGISVAYTVAHGGGAFPDTASPERYCLPYGPMLYIVLGLSQLALGASTFSSKLPCCMAAIFSAVLFWRILRRQGLPVTAACAIAGLNATIVLSFRHVVYWTKSDSLICLTVMVSVWAALRRGWLGPRVLGACIGIGVGLKLSAGAYFIPVLVIALCNGWGWRDFAICGTACLAFAILPFVLLPVRFPWMNYLAFFRTVSREGLDLNPTIAFLRWLTMLAGLVVVSDRFIRPSSIPQSRLPRWAYRGALAAGLALVAVPACAVGSGPHHLMPFVPLVLLAFGDLFTRDENRAWQYSGSPLWRTAVCAIFSACFLIALQTASQIIRMRAKLDPRTRDCQADLRAVLASHSQAMILMGTSGNQTDLAAYSRHLIVFAGHPIGLDAAVVSDYQFGGIAPPDLPTFLRELRTPNSQPILWLFPRGGTPFEGTNWYAPNLPIYPEKFRRDFAERFKLRESTPFFDIYSAAHEG